VREAGHDKHEEQKTTGDHRKEREAARFHLKSFKLTAVRAKKQWRASWRLEARIKVNSENLAAINVKSEKRTMIKMKSEKSVASNSKSKHPAAIKVNNAKSAIFTASNRLATTYYQFIFFTSNNRQLNLISLLSSAAVIRKYFENIPYHQKTTNMKCEKPAAINVKRKQTMVSIVNTTRSWLISISRPIS
jgi:hypothetical protein